MGFYPIGAHVVVSFHRRVLVTSFSQVRVDGARVRSSQDPFLFKWGAASFMNGLILERFLGDFRVNGSTFWVEWVPKGFAGVASGWVLVNGRRFEGSGFFVFRGRLCFGVPRMVQ